MSQMKLAVFVFASVSYLYFLAAGWSSSLSVYHSPRFCWVAGAFALLAIIMGVYCVQDNSAWREKLKQVEAQESAYILVAEELIAWHLSNQSIQTTGFCRSSSML